MAEALGHSWGQIIGDMFEEACKAFLLRIADETGIYLDFKKPRAARSNLKTVRWKDANGDSHQLDYVFEQDGTEAGRGIPIGFVEIAWRRYTKHSKNKAQEIQGAVLPIAEKYHHTRPFLGAILSGDFTGNSLAQLRNSGFSVIHLGIDDIDRAFRTVGIVARYDERTPEVEFAERLRLFRALPDIQRKMVRDEMLRTEPEQFAEFAANLKATITRRIERIIVLPLHGELLEASTAGEAVSLISSYVDAGAGATVHRYEIEVRYSNGANVRASFPTKAEAVGFLRTL